jgi:hypothetical protein
MTNKTKQVMIADYFPGMGLPGRDGEDGVSAMRIYNNSGSTIAFGIAMTETRAGI